MLRRVFSGLAPIAVCQPVFPYPDQEVHLPRDSTTSLLQLGDGVVYARMDEGKLHAIDIDGSTKWIFNTSASLSWWFAEVSDALYTITNDDTLLSIDKLNGSVQWQYQFIGLEPSGKPAVARDGTVFLDHYGCDPQALFCHPLSFLDVLHNNGTLKWSRNITDEYVALIDPDRAVLVGAVMQHSHVAEDDSILQIVRMNMLSAETGEVKWRWTSPEASDITPLFVLEDGSVLVLLRTVKYGQQDNKEQGGASVSLLRLSGEDGRTLWTVSSTGFGSEFRHTYVHRGRESVYVNEWIGVDGTTELHAFDFDGNSLFSMPSFAETKCYDIPSSTEFLPRAFNADGDTFIVNQICANTSLNRNLTQSVSAYSGVNGTLLWETSEFDFGAGDDWTTNLEIGQDGSTLFATSQNHSHYPFTTPEYQFASAISNGKVLWRVPTKIGFDGLSHPITADDGTTYLLGDEVIAVGSDGLEKWRCCDKPQDETLVLV